MTSKPRAYDGGCLCGATRFRALGPPLRPHTCSCKMCQRHSGALTLAWVEFPKDSVTWTGRNGAPATYRSSDVSSRAYCRSCGGTIGAIDDEPTVALLLGVFDKPGYRELRPSSHSYRAGCPRWWKIDTAGP